MAHNVQAKPEDFTESGSSPPSGAVLSSPPTQPPRQPSRRRRTPRRGRPSGRRRTETPLDPFALARSDIANQARDNKNRRLLRHWWRDRDGHYQTVDEVSARIGLTHWATRYIDRHGLANANGNLRQVTGSQSGSGQAVGGTSRSILGIVLCSGRGGKTGWKSGRFSHSGVCHDECGRWS